MNIATQIHRLQIQSLTITPQLIQSIQLLQYSGEELEAFLSEQMERNPLLDITRDARQPLHSGEDRSASTQEHNQPCHDTDVGQASVCSHDLNYAQGNRVSDRPHSSPKASMSTSGVDTTGNKSQSLENYCASSVSLKEYLRSQLAVVVRNKADLILTSEIVESLDPDGYLRREIPEIARVLGVDESKVAAAIEVVQTLEPTGVGARNLSECLRIQLRERNRLDHAMSILLENLQLLADYRVQELAKFCGVSREDILDMAKEIRELDPRPGHRFDSEPILPALPDVLVEVRQDGTLVVDLNSEMLPKVLINREYYAEISTACSRKEERKFVVDCWKSANLLARNMDQRAQTILKVATEIVTRQRAFFLEGVEHLQPLSLKDVAQAVGLHESTVSRATSNKYMSTNRGTFELKFFFANSIASSDGGADFSAETIRHKIKNLIDAETADTVLSDDAIVAELRRSGVDIARRTIAKYRDVMNIGSSLQRRRHKQALEAA